MKKVIAVLMCLAGSAVAAETLYLTGEMEKGVNRVCIYEGVYSVKTVTIPIVSTCAPYINL